MTFNEAGLKIIEEFESCELKSYQDSRGIWTVGYGHTQGVRPNMIITKEQAEYFLECDITETVKILKNLVPKDLNDNEFSALVSLAFNIGTGRFNQSSIHNYLLSGNKKAAADSFLLYDQCKGKVLGGLERRRAAERALFLKPV